MSLIQTTLAAYSSGKFSARDEVSRFFSVIEEKDKAIGAFLSTRKEKALREAEEIDRKKEYGKNLSGITGGIKDIICTKGEKTTAASKILKDFIPPYNATVIEKLNEAGFISVGKTNCDEFANGSSTEYSAFQLTRNPQDITLVPGGSSGGSAAAVAAGECVFALGTDTGGSIRQPANFCGVVGLKPSYGRVSRYGAMSYASSFDTIGPFTKTVEDAAIVLSVIAGKDEKDSTTVDAPVPNYAERLSESIKGKKVGLVREYMEVEGLDPEMRKVVEMSAERYRAMGAEIVEVSIPLVKYSIATYFLLAKAEASTNYAKYDGVRFGHLSKEAKAMREIYTKSRSEGFGDEIKRAIMMGTYTLSAGYYDAYYLKAAKVRTLLRKEFDDAFEKADVLLTPVSPTLPFAFGAKSDPLQMYLADLYTVAPSIVGVTGISVPTEKIGKLTTGVQIIGPRLGEETILNFGWHLEQSYSS